MESRAHWARLLQTYQIRPSYTRIAIFAYWTKSKKHPSADEIYVKLTKGMPKLTKMTVYNTLRILVDKGLAREASIEEHEARDDADVSLHGHFKCIECHGITNFPVQEDILAEIRIPGYEVFEKDVFFRGKCPSCHTGTLSR